MPHLRSNRELLTAFRAGDRDALQKVYWLYVRAVEAVIRRLFQQAGSGRCNDVLDAVQETFIRAFAPAARQSYDGVRDYGPYLNVTARNVALRWLEKHGRESPVEPDALTSRLATPNSPSEEALWEDPEILVIVHDYLAGLPEDMRAVHRLRYTLSVPQREAAEQLGMSRQHLRTLEKRIQDGLRARIELHGGAESADRNQPKRNRAG
jgi:RNA polymerase sigma factor (sigma-70 family)